MRGRMCARFCLVGSVVFVAAAEVASSAAAGADVALTIAANGRSDYAIVRPAAATPSQIYAAEELREFTRRMTGAELPIVTDAEPLPAKAFLLGVTKYTAKILGASADAAALGDDGFLLRTAGPHVLVVAGGVRGTLYGVYELLEHYGGCRWYAADFSVIPARQTWRLPALDDRQVPAFAMREPFWWGMFDGDFAARCRVNGNRMALTAKHGGKIRFGDGLFVHTFYRLMPPEEFFADHPEYYSELDGKRRAELAQLCLSNPDVLRIVTERVLEHIRRDPTAKLFSVSQNDWGGACTCPACRAIDEREGSHAGSLIHFVNQVAETVEKEFPDVWIETLAYQYTRHPPATIRPRRNVVPRLCSIECDFSLPLDVSPYAQNVAFVKDIRGWAAITDKLYVWDYTTNFGHYLGPHPNFACLQGNARLFRDNHVVGLFEQGAYQSPHAEFAELRAWLLAKLLWNPDCDFEALLAEFLNGYYGKAAPLVRTYFDKLQALVRPPDKALLLWSPMTSPWYTDAFFDEAAGLWARAEQAVADDPARLSHVRMGALPVMYAQLARWPKQDVRYEWDGRTLVPVGGDLRYTALAREFLERVAEGHITHVAESRERHDSFMTTLRLATGTMPTIELSADGHRAMLMPDCGGRVLSLAGPGGTNILHGTAGGIDFVPDGPPAAPPEFARYAVDDSSPRAVVLSRTRHGRDTLKREVVLTAGGRLDWTTEAINARNGVDDVHPVVRAALALDDVSAVYVRVGAGPWRPVPAPVGKWTSAISLPADALAGGALTVASRTSGRGAELHVPAAAGGRVIVCCDGADRSTRVLALAPLCPIPAGGRATWALDIAPAFRLPGLPSAVAAADGARDIVVDEWQMPIARVGTWGECVADPAAEDGYAAKLFNTHYEWCIQWTVPMERVEPGIAYALKARIRVEHGQASEGEAFWAGVYDRHEKRGVATIAPRAASVADDDYHWYNAATWTPGPGQCVWFAPGRFDAKTVKTNPAIRAVYIDRLSLQPAGDRP